MLSRPAMHKIAGSRPKETLPLLGLFAAGALILAFAKIAQELSQGDFQDFDRGVLLALRRPGLPTQAIGPLWLQVAARDITSLGSPAILTCITASVAGFLMLTGKKAAALYLVLAIAGGAAVSFALKGLVGRPRPEFAAEVTQTQTFSFPSGHAFLSAVLFLTIGALLARSEPRTGVKIYILSVCIAFAVLTGLSRLYLGVHWPTDVIAGWCGGAAWALLCAAAASRFEVRASA